MLSLRRLHQLKELAESHPQYFRWNYYKELRNAGYEEISTEQVGPKPEAKPSGHGKKILFGVSLIKAKQRLEGGDESTDESRTASAGI